VKLPRTDYAPKGIELTDEEFHALHMRLDRTRRNSTTVTVDRQALARLLADHSRLYAALDAIERSLRHAEAA
jgi:hypothetical protein